MRAMAWIVGLIAAGLALRHAGGGDLGAPPMTSMTGLDQWAESRSAATAAMAIVRQVAELATWYLVALSLIHGFAAGGGRTRRAVADALSVPGARRMVRAGLGLGLAASSIGSVSTDSPRQELDGPGQGRAVMSPIKPEGDGAPAGAATMVPVVDGTATMTPVASGVSDQAPAPPPPAARPSWPSTWTVAEGESMWSIAAELLADHTEREPAVAEVDPLWRRLIEINVHRLVDPSDPDLILPGQVFEVPAQTP